MNFTACEYHATVPARWRCGACELNFCVNCAQKDPKASVAMCPSCGVPTLSLGIGNTIKPFWERIPRFFAYPFQLDAAVTLIALSVAAVVTRYMPFGLIFAILVYVATVRYCYRVLYHTALGHLEPPGPMRDSGEFSGIFWQQTAFFLAWFGGAVFVGMLTKSVPIYVLCTVLAVLLLPAGIMTLAVQENLAEALNPFRQIAIAVRIGRYYLLLWLMLLLLLFGEGELVRLTAPRINPTLGSLVYHFLSFYFSIAMFHMMGYVVYQYHEELGFTPAKDYAESQEASKDFQKRADTPPPDRAQILITEGKYAEATQELEALVNRDRDDLKTHDRLNHLLAIQGKTQEERGLGQADFYIGKLVAQKQHEKALEVYRRSVAAWPALQIKEAEEIFALASHAHARRDGKTALSLLGRFEQRFPSYPRVPEVQLLTARLMSEVLGRDELALQIVERLRRNHPEHALRAEMDSLASLLQRLVQTARREAPRQ
jgi:tetratricopeptide (TPR) repeat protein